MSAHIVNGRDNMTRVLGRLASDKIRPISDLATIAKQARQSGKKVVLAHGVFDILHIGHKRHLEVGAKAGDLLIVTVTADRFVNKGPGRPVFPEQLRSEMLASLNIVDYVGISHHPGAEPIIEAIQPSLYLKGSEYSVEEKDVTGRITTERASVEHFGGEVMFTEDITFSSSNLANRVLQIYPDEAQAYLKDLRGRLSIDRLMAELDRANTLRCLVIGDTILDEYIYVDPLGKPSKENIISTRYKDKELFCGGAVATANTLAQFATETDLVTLLGDLESYEDVVRSTLADGLNLVPFYRKGARTTRKSRLVDPAYFRKLIEVAYLHDEPLPNGQQAELNGWVSEHIGKYDAVIVNDFGHGLIDKELIDLLCDQAAFLAINAQTNSANRGFNLITKYPRADLICVDEPEARLAGMDRFSPIEEVVTGTLKQQIDCSTFIVTHGKLGCLVIPDGNHAERIPALSDRAIDTIGAGDAFFAAAAPLMAAGCDPFVAAFVGNAVGAMKINIIGHRHQLTRAEFVKYLQSLLK